MPHPKRLRGAAITFDPNFEYKVDDSRNSKLSKKKQRIKQDRPGLLRNMFSRTGQHCPSADRAQPAHSPPDWYALKEDRSSEDHPGSARIDVDNSPWARPTILALDGGGVRGFATLLVIQELMKKIEVCQLGHHHGSSCSSKSATVRPFLLTHCLCDKKIEKDGLDPGPCSAAYSQNPNAKFGTEEFLPCHYFDYIAGTSTGGLSAIMLGRLRMSISDALSQYQKFGTRVFGHPRMIYKGPPFFFPRARYSTRRMRTAILEVVKTQRPEYNRAELAKTTFKQDAPDHCKTIAVARDVDHKKHFLFRSYDHHVKDCGCTNNGAWKCASTSTAVLNPGQASSVPIWKAARATSAAPVYFQPMVIEETKLMDGGIGANNPALVALLEVRDLHPKVPTLLLSIGTGVKSEKNRVQIKDQRKEELGKLIKGDVSSKRAAFLDLIDLAHYIGDYATDTEANVSFVDLYAKDTGLKHVRLNPSDDVGKVRMDEWLPSNSGKDTLEKLRILTEAYIEQPEVQGHLDEVAKDLVATRRARANGPEWEQWERFATNFSYHCPVPDCEHKEVGGPLKRRRTLQHHLEKYHPGETDMNDFLNRGRVPVDRASERTKGATLHR